MDFDNTIVSYDRLFDAVARERNLVVGECSGSKRGIRDAIRSRPNGESEWQLLQADVYGQLIGSAIPFPGVNEFVTRAHELEVHISIVSHKTKLAAAGAAGCDLHQAALSWLRANKLIGSERISATDVYFEPSRAAKLYRIGVLAPNIFVDDLAEIFTDPEFPAQTRPWLFSPSQPSEYRKEIEHFESWQAMLEELQA